MAGTLEQEKEKMRRGEMYYSFHPGLLQERQRAHHACHEYNKAGEISRRERVHMWRDIINDTNPVPAPSAEVPDDILLSREPYIEPPFNCDYGYNIILGEQVYINFNCTILDTCTVRIGSRTMLGPNVALFSATHPTDPTVRNGLKGPEMGKQIQIGEDCWIGGNVVILPGITIGNGSTVGAGSVVTKDVPPFTIVAGNPARVIRSIPKPTEDDTDKQGKGTKPVQKILGGNIKKEIFGKGV